MWLLSFSHTMFHTHNILSHHIWLTESNDALDGSRNPQTNRKYSILWFFICCCSLLMFVVFSFSCLVETSERERCLGSIIFREISALKLNHIISPKYGHFYWHLWRTTFNIRAPRNKNHETTNKKEWNLSERFSFRFSHRERGCLFFAVGFAVS